MGATVAMEHSIEFRLLGFYTLWYCSSLHGREGRGQQSSLGFNAVWTRQRAENRADFDRVKKVLFTLPLRNCNQSVIDFSFRP